MVMVWLLILFLLLPRVVSGQPTPVPGAEVLVPRIAPAPTIPAAPDTPPPVAPPEALRPGRMFELQPRLGISTEYTDNFNRTRDDQVSNLRSGISPGLLLLFERGFLTGQAGYAPRFFHDTAADDFGTHHALTGQLAWQATPRFRLSTRGLFTQHDNPELADRLDLRRPRRSFTRGGFSASGDYAFEPYTARGYYRFSSFSSTEQTTLSHTVGATGSVLLARTNTVTLGYEYLDSETTTRRDDIAALVGGRDSATRGHQVTASFARELTRTSTAGVSAAFATRERTATAGDSDFERWSTSVFYNYVLADRLTLRASVGVAQLSGATVPGRPLFTTSSDLRYLLGRLVLGVGVERGFSETFADGPDFGIVETTGYSASASYRFSPLLVGAIRATYRENRFTGAGARPGQRDSETFTGSASLTYQILRWLTGTVDYTHRNASRFLGGFEENRVRAALNASFY